MNAQLQKHLILCNEVDVNRRGGAIGWGLWRQSLSSWARRLYEKRTQPHHSYRDPTIIGGDQESSTRFLYAGLVLLLALFGMVSSWNLVLIIFNYDATNWWVGGAGRISTTRRAFVAMVLVGSMSLLAVHTIRARMERRRLGRAQALRHKIYLQVSELLGSIGAPFIESQHIVGKQLGSSDVDDPGELLTYNCDEDDANAFVRFVRAESESQQIISSCIQTIETTTRFFPGGTTMAIRRSSTVLPNLRHRIHALLRTKVRNLKLLRKALTVAPKESVNNDEELFESGMAGGDNDVITLSRLREMKKQAAQLLSDTCELVLLSSAPCLNRQRSLLEQLWLECQGVSAFLKPTMNASIILTGQTDRSSEREREFVTLADTASSLHLALMSLYEQETTASDDEFDANSKVRLLQQWQATALQAQLLSERIHDRLARPSETEQEDETGQDDNGEEASLKELSSTLEGDDNSGGRIGFTSLRCADSMVGETLVYADVADPPKPRHRPPRQDRSENARKGQTSPFELIEELQIRLQMMTVPKERPAR